MFDAKKLLDQFLGSQGSSTVRDGAGGVMQMAKNNPLASGAIVAGLFGTKTGRKLTKNAVKIGGVAAVAGLGYLAYKNYKSGQAPQAQPAAAADEPVALPPPESPFNPDTAPVSNDFALTLVRAMIAAAKADGHIDADERRHIMEKVHGSGLDAEAEAFIDQELANPTDVDALVSAARTEEQKVELYTASRLAIEPDNRAERGYLDMLAGRLGLPDPLVDHIDATVSAAKV